MHISIISKLFVSRRVAWRCQRGNQNPYIEEEQTTQWPKEKVQRDKQLSTKHTHKTKDRATRTPLNTGGELRCSGILHLTHWVAYAGWLLSLMHDFQLHDIPKGGNVCSNSWEHISRSGEVSVFNTWEHIHEMCLSIVYGFIVGLCSQFYMTEFGLICEHTFEARLYRHTLFYYAQILKLSLCRYYTG